MFLYSVGICDHVFIQCWYMSALIMFYTVLVYVSFDHVFIQCWYMSALIMFLYSVGIYDHVLYSVGICHFDHVLYSVGICQL